MWSLSVFMLPLTLLVWTVHSAASCFVFSMGRGSKTRSRHLPYPLFLAPTFFLSTVAQSTTSQGGGLVLTMSTSKTPPSALGNQGEQPEEGMQQNTDRVQNQRPIVSSRPRYYYNWREFKPGGGVWNQLRWIVSGRIPDNDAAMMVTQEDLRADLAKLARLLVLLREYKARYGVPRAYGRQSQKNLLADLTKELYQSGAPTWVLEPVMERVAEGLTGQTGVQFSILPRRAFIFYPSRRSDKDDSDTDNLEGSGTDMYKTHAGFVMHRLSSVESVAVRLASFASNTQSVERLGSAAIPTVQRGELARAKRQSSRAESSLAVKSSETTASPLAREDDPSYTTREGLASAILDLASESYGLFYFLNTLKFQAAMAALDEKRGTEQQQQQQAPDFWRVTADEQALFSKLAAQEATTQLAKIRSKGRSQRVFYPPLVTSLLRFGSSAGASAMWFGGSLYDMIMAGMLAILVGNICSLKALVYEERALTEVAASFVVGLTAGLLSIKWPKLFCFGAIAIPATLDLMQGFKVVYAVIEVLSKNIVAGGARVLEGLLFTGLIAYNLKFGMNWAIRLALGMKHPLPQDFAPFLLPSHGGIDKIWYLFLLPMASISWSGLFRPRYLDLPVMAFHGMLAFTLNMLGVNSFVAAMILTFCAGLQSRFSGRQALGNTVAGLYALVPGAYMTQKMFATPSATGFIERIMAEAASIGLGAWTGTILCSPTILGKTSGFHGRSPEKKKPETLFFF